MLTNLSLSVLLIAQAGDLTGTPASIGDNQVDGRKIAHYDLTWSQCAFQNNEWTAMPALRERVDVITDHILRVAQYTKAPDGNRVNSTAYYDRQTFAPIRMEQHVAGASGDPVARVDRVFEEKGNQATIMQGDKTAARSGTIGNRLYHGGALGLPLATLNYTKAPFLMNASMINFNATYKLWITLAGTEKLTYEDQELQVSLVDVEWHHNEAGDVYPPGPDASGGRYWVIQEPSAGLPYILRYKTDTYAVEFLKDICP